MQVDFDMSACFQNDQTRQNINDELRQTHSRFRVVFLDNDSLDKFDSMKGDASLDFIAEILS